MKTIKLHFRSLLSAHNGESSNPYLRSSPNWLAWEAIERTRKQGRTVLDVWCGRGFSVNVRTEDRVESVSIL